MKIDEYSFGRMRIGEKIYNSDLVILPDGRVVDSWWRKEGHSLCTADLEGFLEPAPEIIIVGLGAYSCMEIPGGVRADLEKPGTKLISADTASAVKEYNNLHDKRRLLGAFHLTC
ncbi:MAG: MTH938/NDUFAF3 family protein [Chloroflexi bacterium]|nr:MTH938/NDUFAF3 family protein [Chloroflexota bacterium]